MQKNKKIVCFILGTRPEAVKMAPLIQVCNKSQRLKAFTIVTAQHREIMDSILKIFNVTVDLDLDIMQPDQTLSALTAKVLTSLEKSLNQNFDVVLSQGDTTTVLASALSCFYQKIKFGHIEAGLRTGNSLNPFPEEINRVLTSKLANWHFAPTPTAARNLIDEGILACDVFMTGNTIIDALRIIKEELSLKLSSQPKKRYVLITAHRRENFGKPFEDICQAILELAKKFSDINFVYPVHPNPNIHTIAHKILANVSNIKLLPSLDYRQFVELMYYSYFIMTDSGGVEEEAPALNKPLLVLREFTERPEVIELGLGELVGTSTSKIVAAASRLLTDSHHYTSMCKNLSPYGDGYSANKIMHILEEKLCA